MKLHITENPSGSFRWTLRENDTIGICGPETGPLLATGDGCSYFGGAEQAGRDEAARIRNSRRVLQRVVLDV